MSASAYTTAIAGIGGAPQVTKVPFLRLGDAVRNYRGDWWRKATVFSGLGAPRQLVVSTQSLFLDKGCKIPMFARVVKT